MDDTTLPSSAHKPFFCLEVEPAEDARPEVQATTIGEMVTPLMEQSQSRFELPASEDDGETGRADLPYPFDQLQLSLVKWLFGIQSNISSRELKRNEGNEQTWQTIFLRLNAPDRPRNAAPATAAIHRIFAAPCASCASR
jgi:hypothetical protein